MEATMIRHGALTFCAVMLGSFSAFADDQTQIGAGNARAQQIGSASPLVQSAVELLERNARQIENAQRFERRRWIRSATPTPVSGIGPMSQTP
jgi:hypothetical protein